MLDVVGGVRRRVEDGEDGIAQEIDHEPVVCGNDAHQQLAVIVEDRHDLLRAEALREGGEAAEIGEEDGNVAPLARQYRLAALQHDVTNDFLRGIARERSQARVYATDRVLELGDLANYRARLRGLSGVESRSGIEGAARAL